MGRRRAIIVLSAAIALLAGGLVMLAGRLEWFDALIIPLASAVGTLALIALLGPARGGVVALILLATVHRYPAEIAGASVKPEHVAAPIVALALAPRILVLVRRLSAVDWLFLGWLAWSIVGGVLYAADPANSTRLWAMLLLVAFPYFVIVTTVTTPGRMRFVFDAWLLIGIAAGIFGILTHLLYAWDVNLGIQINPVTADPTVPSTFREANLFGSAMMVLALVGIALIVFGARPRPLTLTAIVVSILGLQVSFTRTAWIAFVAGLLLLAAFRAYQSLRQAPAPVARSLRPVGAVVAGVTFGTLLLWIPIGDTDAAAERDQARATMDARATEYATTQPAEDEDDDSSTGMPLLRQGTPTEGVLPTVTPENPDIVGRIGSIGDAGDSSVRIRVEFARQALSDWQDFPITGSGVGSFGQRYTTSSFDRAWLSNVFVRVLHDSGIIGLALFLAPLAILAWQTLRLVPAVATPVNRLAVAFGVAIAAMFVAFQATEGFQIAWYWIALGLFAAAVRLATDRQRSAVGA